MLWIGGRRVVRLAETDGEASASHTARPEQNPVTTQSCPSCARPAHIRTPLRQRFVTASWRQSRSIIEGTAHRADKIHLQRSQPQQFLARPPVKIERSPRHFRRTPFASFLVVLLILMKHSICCTLSAHGDPGGTYSVNT